MLYFFDLLGTFAFGLTGGLVAVRKNMDLFGIFVLAMVTAVGGGIVRDMLLQRAGITFFNDPVYLYTVIASTLCTFLFFQKLFRINAIILIVDALGLGTFVCIGVSKAMASGLPVFGAVIMGLITAVVGGLLRDVLAREVPVILTRDFYAMSCIIGGIVYTQLFRLGVPEGKVMLISAFVVVALRLLAIRYKWNFIGIKGLDRGIGDNNLRRSNADI